MRWLTVSLVATLAACDQGPDEPFPVPAVVGPEEVTIPLARYTAPAQIATFTIENTGALTMYASPALTLAVAPPEENPSPSPINLDTIPTLLTVNFPPFTEISPEQTKPLQVSLDDRPWRWRTGEFTVVLPVEVRYLWMGQAAGDPDPVSTKDFPTSVPARFDLKVHFSIDCDLDGDTFDAIECGGTDCDDQDLDVRPDATETCDGVDEDCDGAIDEGAIDRTTWYLDDDSDGYGDPDTTQIACSLPSIDWRDRAGDCDDDANNVHPDQDEQNCSNGLDDDCDGQTDEDDERDCGT